MMVGYGTSGIAVSALSTRHLRVVWKNAGDQVTLMFNNRTYSGIVDPIGDVVIGKKTRLNLCRPQLRC